MDTLILHYVVESGNNGSSVGLVPILRHNDGRLCFLRTYPAQCNLGHAIEVSGHLLDQSRKAVAAMGSRLNLQAATGFLGTIKEHGAALARLLLPEEIIRLLADPDRIGHVCFCYDPRLNAVPFDCLWLGGEFLGFRCAVGRELLSASAPAQPPTRRAQTLPLRAQLILAFPRELDDEEQDEVARQAVEFCRQMNDQDAPPTIKLDHLVVGDAPTAADVMTALRTRDIVVLYSHHHYDEDQPDASRYVLSPKTALSAVELLDGFKSGEAPPLVIFSLACESAITHGWEHDWPRTTRLYGMVDAAKRIGVAHYIGTPVEIPAVGVIGAAGRFMQGLTAGFTVGEALRKTRVQFRRVESDSSDGGTVLGLALALYGDPSVALISRSGRRVAEVHAPVCEGMTEGSICSKAVAPQDPGYGLRLCPDHYRAEGCSAGHKLTPGARIKRCAKCDNSICPDCSGWGQQLCWAHCCFEGHETVAGTITLCRDPGNRHHGEKRSICPLDPGWYDGLCSDCLRSQPGDQRTG